MAMPPAGFSFDDDWEHQAAPPRYVAVQARVGDLAVFYRKAAVEVSIDGRKLAIVPHGALLLLLRDDDRTTRHVS